MSGVELDLKKVVEARKLELSYIDEKEVWVKITRKEAIRRGIKIIGVRWIDVNKGDAIHPNYRSRLVGKEFNNYKDLSIFAATPPLEALRFIISEAATTEGSNKDNDKVVMINDVSRAFFEADATRDMAVELPEESKSEEDRRLDRVAILKKSLYGARDAAMNIQKEVRKMMTASGFEVGQYNVCRF